MAGYKAMWSKAQGYPSRDFFRALDPRLENLVEDKLCHPYLSHRRKGRGDHPPGREDHGPSARVPPWRWPMWTLMCPCPPPVPPRPASMLMIMGTSTCDIIVCRRGAHRARHVRRGGRRRGSGAVAATRPARAAWATTSTGLWTTACPRSMLRRPGQRARTCTCISRKRRKSCSPAKADSSPWTGGTATVPCWWTWISPA